MINFLAKIASQVYLDFIYIDLAGDRGNRSINLKLKNLAIKDEENNGIIIDELDLYIKNFMNATGSSVDFESASYVFSQLNILISEAWVNKVLSSDENLKSGDLENLRVKLTPKKMSILGTLKKGISFNFSVDIKFMVDKGRLIINLDRFWAVDLIPLPRWVQKTILGFAEKYIEKKKMHIDGISFVNHYILIDHRKLIPVDCYLDVQKVFVQEDFLAIQCGTDKDDAMRQFQAKVKAKKETPPPADIKTAEPEKQPEEKNGEQEQKEAKCEKLFDFLEKMQNLLTDRVKQPILVRFKEAGGAPLSHLKVFIDGETAREVKA